MTSRQCFYFFTFFTFFILCRQDTLAALTVMFAAFLWVICLLVTPRTAIFSLFPREFWRRGRVDVEAAASETPYRGALLAQS